MRKVSGTIVLVSMGISISERGAKSPGAWKGVGTRPEKGGKVNELMPEDARMQSQAEVAGDYEQCLARDVLAGDTQAIEEFKELLRPRIYALVRLHPGPRQPAYEYADRVDHVTLYLMMGVRQTRKGITSPGFSPLYKWATNPQGSLIAYCLVSARNYLIDLSRIREIATDPLPEKEAANTSHHINPFLLLPQEEELFDKELKRAVQDIYEKVPPHDRRILMLRYHFEMTDVEIGRELSISETAARIRRNRAEEKFRGLFLNKYGHLV